MQWLKEFKHSLACVFDDNLHTKVWHNIADWVIIALIIISSLEIFLSTFEGLAERYGKILHIIDVVTTVIFSIEVTLRIWTADEIDPKYKGIWGRVRYCCSFYGMIDFLSTYPALLGIFLPIPVTVLKIFRVARLLRIFRYLKSFKILEEAIASKKQELLISLSFLSILTVILSFLLYFAEHGAQPELCENGWKTLVWAFAKYLGDPGKIADFPLVTTWGNIIAIFVGVLGICIFAVPAGLIGSGFIEVIEERNHRMEIEENKEHLRHSFRWEKDQHCTGLFYVPAFKTANSILTKQFLTEAEIVEAVKNSKNLHLYNLAKAYNTEDAPADSLVVVNCPNNRPYGYCIDRGSKVTIVSTSGHDEPITSWVAYHIAKIGRFNYVGKEIEEDPDNPVSFYNIDNLDGSSNLQMFINDIKALSAKENSWVIPMCFCIGPKTREHEVHLCYSPVKGDHGFNNPDCTVKDVERFQAFAADLSKTLEEGFGVKIDCNDYYVSSKKMLAHFIPGCNGFALRFECRAIYFPANKIARIKAIADALNRAFEPDIEKHLPQEMLEHPRECFGFEDYKD